jgi:hypothetical protein
MSNVFSIKALFESVETTFGTAPASGYTVVAYAEDITWAPKVETFEFKSLKAEFGEDDRYITHTRSTSTLSFKVPMHSFLVEGASYSTPAQHQLEELLYHCLGGHEIVASAPDTPTGVAPSDEDTPKFASVVPVDTIGRVTAVKPDSNSHYQGRCINNVKQSGGYYGQISGKYFDLDDAAVTPDANSDMYHGVTAYYGGSHTFPTTYTFELVGGASDDGWILV